jgi:hypothetical protein
MRESDVSFDQGRLRESLVYARRAASLYAPGLPHIRSADARLDAIASGAESGRLPKIALLAWQAIRSSELLRPFGMGRTQARLALANRRLTDLLAANGNDGAWATEERNSAQLLAELEARSRENRLSAWGQLLSVGVVFAGLVAMATGIERRGLLSSRVYWGAAVGLLGAIGWAGCLLLA